MNLIIIIVISVLIFWLIIKKNIIKKQDNFWRLQSVIGCDKSYKVYNNICLKHCPVNTYSPNNSKECINCPANMISDIGSTSIEQCICPAGFVMSATGCNPCGNNKYSINNNSTGCFNCPINSTSFNNNSSDIDECVCNNGYTRINDHCIPNLGCTNTQYYNITTGLCTNCQSGKTQNIDIISCK